MLIVAVEVGLLLVGDQLQHPAYPCRPHFAPSSTYIDNVIWRKEKGTCTTAIESGKSVTVRHDQLENSS
jgi:hypothetical protein